MAFIKCSGGGNKTAYGEVTLSKTEVTKITLGWKPSLVCTYPANLSQGNYYSIYNKYYSTSAILSNSNTAAVANYSIPNTMQARITSIENDGFSINKQGNGYSYKYAAAII